MFLFTDHLFSWALKVSPVFVWRKFSRPRNRLPAVWKTKRFAQSVGQFKELSSSYKLFLPYVTSHVYKRYGWLTVPYVKKDMNILSYVNVHRLHVSHVFIDHLCEKYLVTSRFRQNVFECTAATGPILLKFRCLNTQINTFFILQVRGKYHYVTCKQSGLGSVICKRYSYCLKNTKSYARWNVCNWKLSNEIYFNEEFNYLRQDQ